MEQRKQEEFKGGAAGGTADISAPVCIPEGFFPGDPMGMSGHTSRYPWKCPGICSHEILAIIPVFLYFAHQHVIDCEGDLNAYLLEKTFQELACLHRVR
ncbi:MAG: hypothetical protein LLG43_13220, partial [Deltaproteobacteria bacterium]|nr:hypothetical protein [Deltaproteobacteria bacterium]